MAQGYPYRSQNATVMLNAESGALQAFSLNYPSPPASAATLQLSQNSANSVAATVLAGAGITTMTCNPRR